MGSEVPGPAFSWASSRLSIQPLRRRHVVDLVAYRRDPTVARLQSWDVGFSITDADNLVLADDQDALLSPGDWIQLAVLLADSALEVLVGDIGVHVLADQPDSYELGITVDPRHQGKGYAREALSVVIDGLMGSHGAHRVILQTDARNASMIAVARAIGFRHEGSEVEGDWFKGEWTTLERFAILRREWQKARPLS